MDTLTLKDVNRRNKILYGSLWKTILILSFPLAIYEVFNYLYAFIDLWLVSGLDTSFVTSVIFIDEIRLALTAFGGSIAAAGSVIVARHYASDKIKEAKMSAGNALLLAVIVSFSMVLIMVVFGRYILNFFGATEMIINDGLGYYNIQMITTGLVAFNAVFIGLEKAKGNTKVILITNILVMIIKLAMSYFWIKMFNGGLLELSLSSLIAQGILAMIGMYVIMFYKGNSLRLKINDFKVNKTYIKEIFLLSVPIFLGKFLFNMGKVVINGIALLYHSYVVAALGICGKIFGFFAAIATVFHETEMSVISQNLGVKNTSRAFKAFYISITYAAIVSIIGLVVSHFALDFMISIIGNFNSEQIYIIKETYNFEQYSLVFSALISAMSGLFIGFKRTKVVFWINILRVLVLRLPVLWLMYTFIPERDFRHVGFVMFFSNSITTIICFIMVIYFIRDVKIYGDK